jgi:hypothetical protein
MEHRSIFASLLVAIRTEHDTRDQFLAGLQAEYEEAVLQLPRNKKLRAKKGESPFQMARRANPEAAEALLEGFKAKASPVVDASHAKILRLNSLVKRLAQVAVCKSGSQSLDLDTVWDSSYNSQGWGASRYAQGSAEMTADTARFCGIPVEVLREEIPCQFSKGTLGRYRVVVQVESQVDVEILRRKSTSLRDQVKACWARGVNPRVFNPYLPVGYEERAGLDYFGNDLKKVG